MSGHSKWATIKHQKGAKDAQKGKIFTKLANAITIAAKEGGSDPETNFKLRLVLEKAKAANMPKANTDRAVERAMPGKGVVLEEVTYEGFGPAGIAVLVKVLTDNKNRTLSQIRNIFSDFGGKLGSTGSVQHLFIPRGIITLSSENLDEFELLAIDLGALDTQRNESKLTIFCQVEDLHKIKKELEKQGAKIEDADFSFEPQNSLAITDLGRAKKILQFMEALEEPDEVVKTWANFDLDNSLLKEIK